MYFTAASASEPSNAADATIPTTENASVAFDAILPNVPQLLISFVSYFYNNAFTCMLFAWEWSKFGTHRKSLRVTTPAGQQRSTFWLRIPYRYAVPLMAAMAVLHWLISQSLFLIQIELYSADGQLLDSGSDDSVTTSACGWSALPLLLSIILFTILSVALFGLSWRRLGSGIPMVGSCSLAIAAACSNANETDAATKPLMYGVLTTKEPDAKGTRYVGFSQYDVEPLEDGVAYL